LLLPFHLVLFREAAAHDAARHGADDGVMTGEVPGNTANDCSLDAAFGVSLRGGKRKRERYSREDRKCSHMGTGSC
jgi:hypothetical protein